MLRIVTDGAADLPEEWRTQYQVHVLPLMVRFGEEVYTAGINLNEQDFYRLVEEKKIIPKTSLPSPHEIQQFYRSVAEVGDTILSIHVSSKLSGTFSTVLLAAGEMQDEYLIYPFDSASGSMAMGLMCREARCLDEAGASIEEILQRLEEMRTEQTVIFTLDTLDFAYLSGRVNVIQNLLTQALRVKPIIILKQGVLDMADKVRTRQRSLDRVLEYVRSRVGSKWVYLAVIHAADLEAGKAMLARARDLFNCKDLILSSLTIPVAANLGPRAIGIVAIPAKEEMK